jgi:molybdopterin molybdotransferase
VSRVSDLLSREEALALVLERVVPLPGEEVALEAAAGRVLAKAAHATVDLPGFEASAMDGFAVRTQDVPGRLRLVGRIPAGRPSEHPLGRGETMAISTGAEVPEGADAVVPIEDALADESEVVISFDVRPGANVRSRGGDLSAGALAVPTGVRLGSAHLGALAAAGLTTVVCHRSPSVVVAVTGDELRAPGEPLERGEIYDANGLILATQIRSAGAEPERLAIVRDEPDATRAAIVHGLDHDVLVTSGGVSVGTFDFVRETEAQLGVEEVFWRVAVRPGKPIAFGVCGGTLVFGLPGNPVSSLVGFELFVRPALLALQGVTDPAPAFHPGRLARSATMLMERESLLRAHARVVEDAVMLEPLTGQESHMIARAAAANALVLVRRGQGELPAGSAVSYLAL